MLRQANPLARRVHPITAGAKGGAPTMHSLETIDRINRDAAWREYRHALLAGDAQLARSIYWAELANVVAEVLGETGNPMNDTIRRGHDAEYTRAIVARDLRRARASERDYEV